MHIIANSFGESSGMLDWVVRNELGHQDAISLFQNTGWEHPASIQFGKDQQKYFKTEILFLEYELPVSFEKQVLKHAPAYENLEKYGFEGMFNKDVLDPIRWDRAEVSCKINKQNNDLFSNLDLQEVKADYRRCVREFHALFDQEAGLHQFNLVTADTCNMEGLPMLKVILYYNAIRYIKRLDWSVPNVVHRYCTGRLKVSTMSDFLKRNYGLEQYTKYLGIRKDEPKRYFGNLASKTAKVQVKMPLYDLGFEEENVKDFWDKQAFQLEIRDKKYLGNCVNCHLKTKAKKVMASREYELPFLQQAILENAAGDTMRRVKGHSAEEILFQTIRRDAGIQLEEDEQLFCFC
ncbi:MAG: hypothetical protein R8G66_06215 [Cytophagales bacterium]|nr:hypothetical protein [Cytophagales bacterium]